MDSDGFLRWQRELAGALTEPISIALLGVLLHRRAVEHMKAGRPAAAKRLTGGVSPAPALSPRAGAAGCVGEQLARRKGAVKISTCHRFSELLERRFCQTISTLAPGILGHEPNVQKGSFKTVFPPHTPRARQHAPAPRRPRRPPRAAHVSSPDGTLHRHSFPPCTASRLTSN